MISTADVAQIVLTAVLTGAVSTLGTVAALRVHILYIRETLVRHEDAIKRAHERIDVLTHRAAE